MIHLFIAFVLSFSGLSLSIEKYPDNVTGKVIGVVDGDTIDILYEGKPLRIRLAHIDCPEIRKKQPYGAAAKKFSSDFCFGKQVRILHKNDVDRNKRLIGELFLFNGLNLNKELVKAGLAWHFVKYSTSVEYSNLEKAARIARTGLWKEPNPVAPWNWRKPE
ncbi:thermonuclease family protein [Flavihumibacter sp. UBA7668]|uniref:thermonuclease family protein n=1 Tax=Flavihumibacter sp. UBA7668 TaxID=1946542 RepID=UPI0025BDD4D1|nr:thermonuclease family protein [Flavihumibacter sp. UBA7668]